MLKPVLLILHQETSSPGRVGQALSKLGFPLDVRRPRFGDSLPETMDDHAAAVIFGGPPSANDPDDYIKIETDWIGVPLRDNKPFLGICLGAQMMARKLGAPVTIRKVMPRSAITRSARRLRAASYARNGRTGFINGTARVSICRPAASYWPKATPFRCRPSATAPAMRCSSIRK